MKLHVFPIPITPPTSISTRFLWVFPVHQARALVSCIQPGQVIFFTIDNIHPAPFFKKTSCLFYFLRDFLISNRYLHLGLECFFKKTKQNKTNPVLAMEGLDPCPQHPPFTSSNNACFYLYLGVTRWHPFCRALPFPCFVADHIGLAKRIKHFGQPNICRSSVGMKILTCGEKTDHLNLVQE